MLYQLLIKYQVDELEVVIHIETTSTIKFKLKK